MENKFFMFNESMTFNYELFFELISVSRFFDFLNKEFWINYLSLSDPLQFKLIINNVNMFL